MQKWQDANGLDWECHITIKTAQDLRDAGVDLLTLGADLIQRLMIDDLLLVRVLFLIHQDQAEAAGITPEQFGQALGGQAVAAGERALLEELTDFFRQRGRVAAAESLERTLELQGQLDASRVELIKRELSDPQIQQLIETDNADLIRELERLKSGGGSGKQPEPAGSIPDP